ncbi:hypothetical protein EUTSA_v10010040mg [Eutrema salsugineum]|uniref:Uncharacterized protein n=1 Tax=Eutrema salsugineum TaxID=72664 RepID=V4L3D5_EUTSA|nr:hypothetical protein EUTSA_v10010040mg [Eutrema salsugineum]
MAMSKTKKKTKVNVSGLAYMQKDIQTFFFSLRTVIVSIHFTNLLSDTGSVSLSLFGFALLPSSINICFFFLKYQEKPEPIRSLI